MTIRTGFRRAALALVGATAFALTACGGGAADVPQTSDEAVTVTSTTAAETPVGDVTTVPGSAGTGSDRDVPRPATAAPQPGAHSADGPPCEVTGYTAEAEEELIDEGVGRDEVVDVVARACAGEGEAEWDEDGYWEIEVGDIDVDIRPDGVVRDVDR